MRRRDALAAGLIALAVSGGLALPYFDRLSGLSLDLLFWLRYHAYGQLHPTESSPTVVIGVDEETYRTPPFNDVPVALWTPQIGAVLRGAVAAGARVVGFDIILPTSVQKFLPGHDRDFLRALRAAAQERKVVLAKAQHSVNEPPTRPFPGQSFAVFNQQNIRSVNLFRDSDEVIRRVPLMIPGDDIEAGSRNDPSMSIELTARALGVAPEIRADGRMVLGGYVIPGSERNEMIPNFDGGTAGGIPVFNFADIHACVEAGDEAFLRKHFEGKVVMLGTILDVEDRKTTSKRFITGAAGDYDAPRCRIEKRKGGGEEEVVRDTIPGVLIHATAINNLIRHDALRDLDRWATWGITGGLTLLAAAPVLALPPVAAGAAIGAGALAWTAAATVALRHNMVVPLIHPLAAIFVAFALLLGYRFAVADRDKRMLRSAFGLYLAPSIVDKLVESDTPPALGGETRDVTLFFSDLAGFTAISESLSAGDLVKLMNAYLSEMTDIIEAHGGFVDKYIGDAIAAVFGAPYRDPDHAANATRAALACGARLAELNRDPAVFHGRRLVQRIGLNTGDALVGNIGSRRRFNYTVMGDAVNLASRLEGVNKQYGTLILASGATAERAGGAIAWREIDTVRVMGRDQPVRILTPLGAAGSVAAEAAETAADYARALDDYRARRFADAAAGFERLAERDPPSRVFAARARALAAAPPPADWEPVTTLESK